MASEKGFSGGGKESMSKKAREAADVLVSELGLLHGDVSIRAVDGRAKAVRWTRNWEEGKSLIVEV